MEAHTFSSYIENVFTILLHTQQFQERHWSTFLTLMLLHCLRQCHTFFFHQLFLLPLPQTIFVKNYVHCGYCLEQAKRKTIYKHKIIVCKKGLQ